MRLNVFDKICAVFAILLGGLFMILGELGVFTGCKAHFTLPPVMGILPVFVGWGIVKSIIVAWKNSSSDRPVASTPFDQPSPATATDEPNPDNFRTV